MLILGEVKNGKIQFRPVRISRYRMWGDWNEHEEVFKLTPILEEATKLSLATVPRWLKLPCWP